MSRFAWLLPALCVLAACAGHQHTGAVNPGPLPSYLVVVQRFNARVEPLDRLWSRTVVRAWFNDREGKPQEEQFEGHFQYLRPDQLLLTFDKVGNTYAALGSNQEKYWWLERGTDKGAVAYVGEHSKVTPERVQELGLPVHPLSFVDLLGITPLPDADSDRQPRADSETQRTGVAWSADGAALVITAPGRLGQRRLWLDPQTYLPTRIDLLGADGAPALSATLTNYTAVAVRVPKGTWSPMVPTVLEAVRQNDGLRVRMDLFEPETAGSRPKAAAFDLDNLIKIFDIQRVKSLDAPGGVR